MLLDKLCDVKIDIEDGVIEDGKRCCVCSVGSFEKRCLVVSCSIIEVIIIMD